MDNLTVLNTQQMTELLLKWDDTKDKKPHLSKQDKIDLFLKYKNEGCVTARDELVLSHMNWIKGLALKLRSSKSEIFQDLLQEGVLGLIEALKTYDPEKGAITTHSRVFIQHSMSEIIRKDAVIVIPRDAYLAGEKVSSDMDIIEDAYDDAPLSDDLDELLTFVRLLDGGDKKIVTMHFGLNNSVSHSLDELGITRHRLNKALANLRKIYKDNLEETV